MNCPHCSRPFTEPAGCLHCEASHLHAKSSVDGPPDPAELVGSPIEKDLGIASQHRARLKARIAGNVAPAIYAELSDRDEPAADVAPLACELAEAILLECGL